MNAPDLRLALPAAFAWASLVVLLGFPEALPWASVVAWAAAIACAGLVALRPATAARRGAGMAAAVGLALAGLLLGVAAIGDGTRRPEPLRDVGQGGLAIGATLVTDGVLHAREQSPVRATMTGLMTGLMTDEEVTGLAVPVLAFGLDLDAGIGTRVEVTGRLVPATAGDAVAFLLFAHGEATVTAQPGWALDWANSLRERFRAAALELPGDGGRLLPGLAIGDTSAVGDGLDLAMKETALSHLTAVSGANCAVVVGLVVLAGAALGLSRRWRIAVALVALAGFVVLVTPEASVMRAAVMASVVLVALASGRPVRGVPVLALAITVLLAFDPWLAREYGFVLSVLATAGLLLLTGGLTRTLARWMPVPLAAALAVPIAAQLACQPVLVLLNPAIPIYGVAANLLAGLAAPVATVLGLLACVTLPLLAPVGSLLTTIAWLPSAWIAAAATYFAGLPGSLLPWLPGLLGAVALAALLAAALIAARRGSRWLSIAVAAACVAYGGIVIGGGIGRSLTRPADWQYAACDVGQGDAMVVRNSGVVALIDAGESPELLDDCLDDLGIGRLQLLVLTHFDLDHVGGATALLGRVDHVLVGPSAEPADDRLRAQLAASGATVTQVAAGASGTLGELRWRILWPPARAAGLEPGNPSSLVMHVDGAACADSTCLDALFLGDLGEEEQMRLLASARPPRVDVVKVAHHGSRDQSDALYARLGATVGLIGVGENRYGHPDPRTIALLAGVGTTPARTDTAGLVLVTSDAQGRVVLWSERVVPRQ